MQLCFHLCGASALLLDASKGPFDLPTQERLWAITGPNSGLHRLQGVRSLVLGVNNLLVMFDPGLTAVESLREALDDAWSHAQAQRLAGRLVEVPVVYDRTSGSELEGLAKHAGLDTAEVIRLRTSVDYHVACVGSVPGFPYLVGLPDALAMPRHATPRPRIAKGSVAIGGAQTGIIPMDMPSGWHVLGLTDLALFDAMRPEPSLLTPGDRVRFIDEKAS
jgi:KipI family sensor histidine kinase inhibitor